MPIFNVTIDDVDPFIVYQGAWSDSDHGDNQFPKYLNSTFHATQENGDTASFAFTGTGVYLFGALRINHNRFNVTVDGVTTTGVSFGDPFLFQAPLFGQGNLPFGKHEVVLTNAFGTNTAAPFVDLDFVVITTGDGDDGTVSNDSIIEDSDLNIDYSGTWSAIQNSTSPQSLHRTNSKGSSAKFSFRGNSISLFGTTDVDHGAFSVSLDGATSQVMNGSAPVTRTNMLLYRADGLDNNTHILTLTNLDTTVLDLDYFVVSRYVPGTGPVTHVTPPPGTFVAGTSTSTSITAIQTSFPAIQTNVSTLSSSAVVTSSPTLNSGSGSSSSPSHVPAIVGGTVGGIIFVVAFSIGMWLFLRAQRRRDDISRAQVDLLYQGDPTRPMSYFQAAPTRSGTTYSSQRKEPSSSFRGFGPTSPVASPGSENAYTMSPRVPPSGQENYAPAMMAQEDSRTTLTHARTSVTNWDSLGPIPPRYDAIYAPQAQSHSYPGVGQPF